ncbi:hypothetical protein BST83_09100 [Polaribacter filamentus]|uniref:Uncharacterized protein n=1 Tax=Polaribacter filamentus TaxID=53483 RepID=A0A2S7KXQ2_9FLAO|nr:hypothetical protein [Polaribacter filamentus]PQB07293.1 hypothetical protein BST83_09100 [Polaribacter filamentus]
MKEKEKIADLPQYSEIRNNVQAADSIRKIVKFISFFGFKNKKLNEVFLKIPDLKKQIEHISTIPDKFNSHFSTRGWISHESMNSPLMEKAVELAENGEIEKAEKILSEHFTSSEIKWLQNRFRVLPEFSVRFDIIQKAYQDTLERRFYSCVPLLLIIIDGVVNDISKSKGFFTENTDLTAWDSVAAHSSGLTAIRDIFNTSRKKTNTEEIFLPYRNGILHGRDLKFDNILVVGKCWATLFAINDWARALKKEKENPPTPEKQLSLKESLRDIKKTIIEHNEWKIKHNKIMQELEDWKPRKKEDLNLNPLTFKKFSPEKQAYDIANNWLNKNYGKIAIQLHRIGDSEINIGKEAGEIRSEIQNKILKEFKIINIEDKTPAISEITMSITYDLDSSEMKKEIIMRMICKSPYGEIGMNGNEDIIWEMIDNFFYRLEF